jgi:aryl-alcohol dehydrogenase-like predicted oxidoreductase
MNYRQLGNAGLMVSEIGLGTNQFGGKVDLKTTKEIIRAAVEAGINLIDTADIYQDGRSEEFIGKAVSGIRDQVLIATKVHYPVGEGPNQHGSSRQHIMEGVEASLRRLNVDVIDLYQLHDWDEQTPIQETMRALDDLISSGKVRYLGASNFSSWQVTHANALAELKGWSAFVSVQPHYNMLVREIEEQLLPACEYFGWGVLPYFPLAGGFLTGKYHQDEEPPEGSRGETSEYVQGFMTPENYRKIERLEEFAQARGHTMTELAHAWLLSQPQVSSVISGASRAEHVNSNTRAAGWKLPEADLEEVEGILEN